MNAQSDSKNKTLTLRSKILKYMRQWFEMNNFIGVEAPILVNTPDLSPNFQILTTKIHYGAKQFSKTLITSPEFSMKKLLALDLDKIYTITKVFRDNETETGIHSIEFTMLEWYRKNADYRRTMTDTENLVYFLNKKINPAKKDWINFQNIRCKITPPWPRYKISGLFKKYGQIKNVEKLTLSEFKKIIFQRGYSQDKNLTWEQCFNLIFLNEIESNLPKNQAFFLIDWPAKLALYAKLKNKWIGERYEACIAALELCNGYSELTDGKEQLKRFKAELAERKKYHKQIFPLDFELCKSLALIKKASGNALGIDRLVMILLDIDSIDKVLTFPLQ